MAHKPVHFGLKISISLSVNFLEIVIESRALRTASSLKINKLSGEVSEWLKEHAWKVCIR
jgi:hypothetical protein